MPNEAPKHIRIGNDQILELMSQVFEQGGVFEFSPTGKSMMPMLKEHRDTVVLCSPDVRKIGKRDVVLYLRSDLNAVLHRVIGFGSDGTLILCGDRQTTLESGIDPSKVIGVLSEFTRNGKKISADNRLYKIYAAIWTASRPLRRIAAGAYHILLGKNAKSQEM